MFRGELNQTSSNAFLYYQPKNKAENLQSSFLSDMHVVRHIAINFQGTERNLRNKCVLALAISYVQPLRKEYQNLESSCMLAASSLPDSSSTNRLC